MTGDASTIAATPLTAVVGDLQHILGYGGLKEPVGFDSEPRIETPRRPTLRGVR